MKQYYYALKTYSNGEQNVVITAAEFFDREGVVSDVCSSCLSFDSKDEPIFDEDFDKFTKEAEEKFDVWEETSCWLPGGSGIGFNEPSTFEFSQFMKFLKKHKNFKENIRFTRFIESHS
jgi:hypothetical protein